MTNIKSSLTKPIIILVFTSVIILGIIRNNQFLNFSDSYFILPNLVCLILIILTLILFFYHHKSLNFEKNNLTIKYPFNRFLKEKSIELNEFKEYKISAGKMGYIIKLIKENNNKISHETILIDTNYKSIELIENILNELKIRKAS